MFCIYNQKNAMKWNGSTDRIENEISVWIIENDNKWAAKNCNK